MTDRGYIMESEDESIRLDLKTDPAVIQEQAVWAGLKPGMRLADMGCGPGKTTFHLNTIVQPSGSAVGIDISEQRIRYARAHYQHSEVEFYVGDIRKPFEGMGPFDFIWVRFVLEHYLSGSVDIVNNLTSVLKPGGIMCLVDLDYNCLSHYGIPPTLENTLTGVMRALQERANFDPYAGRKLYSYLYDLGYRDIMVSMSPHHLIFGELDEVDEYNWRKKLEIAVKNSGYPFREYEDGYHGFRREFKRFFSNPRRFTYTPVIACRGRKPE